MRVLLNGARLYLTAALCVLLAGCASQPPAPIEQIPTTATTPRPPAPRANPRTPPKPPAFKGETYRVQAGDTLYSIAWRLGVDFRQLVEWNGIDDPHHIVVGQRLRVQPPRATAAAPKTTPAAAPKPAPSPGTPPVPAAPRASTAQSAGRTVAAPAPVARLSWVWPADGKAVRAVSATGSIGLEIRGTRGQTVRAANSGQVVYAGSGLRGYGQLLIVKHDESFLSAYAHNDKLLVAEGQPVKRGQPIALMGDSGASEVMLHFEIRKGGKAVEPLQYLPKQ